MGFDFRKELANEKSTDSNPLYSNFADMFGLGNSDKTVEKIDIEKLAPYSKHPFKVLIDERLMALAGHIKQSGLIHPIVVRKFEFEERYEILSGHRRTEAMKISGFTGIDAIVIRASDDQASEIVVKANFLQRDVILPSERAKAYQLRNEFLKMRKRHIKGTAGRVSTEWKNDSDEVSTEWKNDDDLLEKSETYRILADEFNDSKSNIFMYIRLNNLIDGLLDLTDIKTIIIKIAVELSYLNEEYQRLIYQYFYVDNNAKLDLDLAKRIRMATVHKDPNKEALNSLLREPKHEKNELFIKPDIQKKYGERFKSNEEFNNLVSKLLEEHFKNK